MRSDGNSSRSLTVDFPPITVPVQLKILSPSGKADTDLSLDFCVGARINKKASFKSTNHVPRLPIHISLVVLGGRLDPSVLACTVPWAMHKPSGQVYFLYSPTRLTIRDISSFRRRFVTECPSTGAP